VLVDSERGSEDTPALKARRAFHEVCRKLNFEVCLTQRRAIENCFSDRAVKTLFGDKYRALSPYERLQDCATRWSKADNWKIARNMSLEKIEGTDVGKLLAAR
jgi:hypothetical protein